MKLPDDGRFAFGTVSDCLQTLESFIEIGVTHFVFNPLVTLNQVDAQLDILASDIIPRFR